MSIRVYNTLSGKKEDFEPIEPGKVRMYVCGPTVYDSSHIGHARSVVVFDVIARYLRQKGFELTYVRNFTDVDDKIIQRANERSTSWQAIAEKYIAEFYDDMDALNVQRADIEPKVSDHIENIIEFVQSLIDKGVAYAVDGDVFFSVEKFPGYGKLSGRRLEDMAAGSRVAVDKRKQNPFDFALWKSAKPDEPYWESPWGKGRPGWHIECSAMSGRYLGQSFDIHGGGKDLIFPHHENEIAQSEAAFDKPFARYWLHNGFVNIDQEKMSKSLGNFLMIKDLLKSHHPETIRLFLLSNHYRSPIDFNAQAMEEASAGLERLYTCLDRLKAREKTAPATEPAGEHWDAFVQAMDDDFNTARGIGVLFEATREANKLLDSGGNSGGLEDILSQIRGIGDILGILTQPPEQFFERQKAKGLQGHAIEPEAIERLIQERAEARKAKDFARADAIRDQLAKMNVILEDGPNGTTWKVK